MASRRRCGLGAGGRGCHLRRGPQPTPRPQGKKLVRDSISCPHLGPDFVPSTAGGCADGLIQGSQQPRERGVPRWGSHPTEANSGPRKGEVG